jgi:hypothetical protein
MLVLQNLKPAKRVEAPKDWRPGLEFDGEQGYAITPGIPGDQVPNFDEFLKLQGFDPEQYEVIGNPRTSRWQRYDGEYLCSYRFNFRLKVTKDLDLPLTWKTVKGNKAKPKVKVESSKALVVMLSDFQIGKVDHRGGVEEMLERVFSAYDQLTEKVRKGKYQKVVICEMGDLIEGFYNKADAQQTYSNDLSIMNQVDLGVSLVWDLIKRLRDYADLTYATVASNHCQFRLNKQTVGKPGQDDWGIVVAKQIDRLAKETDTPLEILIPHPEDESLAYDVFGDNFHVLGLWHGHQVARPEGIPEFWGKQAFSNQPIKAATIGLTGHFHHLRVQELGQSHNGGSRYWIQGKTMDNGSNWYRLNKGVDSDVGITCFELEKGKHYKGAVLSV